MLTISPTGQCALLLLFTGVVAPIFGFVFRRVARGWDSIGKGALAIEQGLSTVPRYLGRSPQSVDPAIQAAEVRQMLEAKYERQRRRGQEPIDVATETERLLETAAVDTGKDATLRSEVRSLVIARNERRMRKGLPPLNVQAETERQLSDFVGSP